MEIKIPPTKSVKNINQSGAALVISVFAILLLTVLGFAIVATGLISQNIARNSREQTEAFYISESGLTHGSKVVMSAGHFQFNNILKAGDGIANTGDELSSLASIPATGINFGKGKYIIYISDDTETDGNPNVDSNKRIVIRSVGIGQNGATVTTEAIMGSGIDPAVLINGKLKVSGNPSVQGSGGIIHANGLMELSGNPCASQYFSSSENITNPNQSRGGINCGVAGTTRSQQSTITAPVLNIQSYKSHANYVLKNDGKIYDKDGRVIFNANFGTYRSNGVELTWISSSQLWKHTGTQFLEGIYYAEGNIEVVGNFGTKGTPASATFIAEGYIHVSGNVHISPSVCDNSGSGNCSDRPIAEPVQLQYPAEKFSLMAGTDLRVTGNFTTGTQSFQGINYSKHQLEITGTPDIYGTMIAVNVADTNSPGCNCNLVPLTASGFMEISGNPLIYYSGGFNSVTGIISWREVRY